MSLSRINAKRQGPDAALHAGIPDVLQQRGAGAQSGMEECKFQFGWERWNCPESALQLSTHNRLRSATRETSFVHAISSAGVMYTLTRNCSMGDFESCGCDDSRNGRVGGRGWVWGGCSDNVEFGERISKLFVDALETGHDTRALINLHNNEVGRLAVKATMKRACKCHGVSGSCSIQTCWLQLADFREIGNYLKMKYDQAHKLEMDKRRMRAGNSADSRGATAETFHHVHSTELVFLEDSPDYCTRNASLGHHGTEGRECLQTGKNLSQGTGGAAGGSAQSAASKWRRGGQRWSAAATASSTGAARCGASSAGSWWPSTSAPAAMPLLPTTPSGGTKATGDRGRPATNCLPGGTCGFLHLWRPSS
uniref:Protein Wnt n=1 Tax=Meleagris gallopavo TaxID=9103 RepID=G1N712_MELGA